METKKEHFQKKMENQQGNFETKTIVIMLFMAFFILTFIGAGSFVVVSFVGLLLCIIGLLQPSVKVDFWILIPLIIYNIISLFSGYLVYGNTLDGLASTQSIFPVIYLLAAYLSIGERTSLKRLCAIWVGLMAVIGIGQFTVAAFSDSAYRLSGLMGNPNAMGGILVLGWFALQSCLGELKEENSLLKRFLQGLEFIILVALALTLSMGSFVALGVGVIAMHLYKKDNFSSLLCKLAEIIFAVGCGILLYIAGDTASWPWLCLIICIYILICVWYRESFKLYLVDHKWVTRLTCVIGICGVGLLVFLRPNAAVTFTERLNMMKNGLGYLGENPLLGVGPYQWRGLNLHDTDIYFNTWHIHNVFIHIGVELGLVAMVMLVITAVCHIRKKEDKAQRGMFFASLTHSMMDTSFFYISTVPFLIMTSAKDERKTRYLSKVIVKCIFGAFAVLFAWNLVQCLTLPS